ncbi:MAG: Gfo/Idh/MocA family oxidoreductase [Candidatus Omnitrophica bacterium]|nr:Gfo/Idh/MocA family oxidoreductase [Candidatus Omnitrophota bacterium]MBU1631560.1 Gfo/Idh/MocA family oxidoreductase [Candidatus Omnitrophota bacterium]MBU1888828.1 Gfo/Idh/MocA family oxidoreductase [Candidatus Omnitrophota bacterium]
MKRIRVAVIGVGYMGQRHARIFSEIENASLVGVCDSSDEQRDKIASNFDTTPYSDYRQLIGKVDGVSIATPTKFHYLIAKYFLENGIHVLVEKVITSSEKEALELIELSIKNKLVLQVGHVERYNSAVIKLGEIVSSPLFIECHRVGPYPGRGTETNVVKEVMIHDLDIILQLVNSPVKSIDAVGAEVLSKTADIVNARIHFASGCVANVTASRVSEKALRKIRIFQKNSYISLDYFNQTIDMLEKGEGNTIKKTPVPIDKKEPLKEELKDFLDCVQYNRQPKVSGEDGLKALQLANLICEKLGK